MRPSTAAIFALLAASPVGAAAQETPPELRAGSLPAVIVMDGRLTEPAWESADAVDDLRQTDPVEGAPPTARTRVQVLADLHMLVIGIMCDEPDASDIVSFSVRRDAVLTNEDHISAADQAAVRVAHVVHLDTASAEVAVDRAFETLTTRNGRGSGQGERLTHAPAPTIIKPVFVRLRAAIVGLSLVPCIALSSALPTEHWHHAGAHHAHATIHLHVDASDHDGAEWSPIEADVVWMDRVAVQSTGFRFFTPLSLPVARTVSPANPIRWIAVEIIDAAPTHGPPGQVLSLRGPPELPSFVI